MNSMDPRITADEIEIGDWYGLPGDRCDGYRAAFVGESVLTGPEHAHLSDEDLLAEAVAEARRADILAEPADHIAPEPVGVGAGRMYRERRGRVGELLRDLKATLKVHGEQAADDPTWGSAADLGKVIGDLEELLRFLRGGG
jgi:hypothetical protein